MLRDALLDAARPSSLRAVASAADLAGYLEGTDAILTPAPSLVIVDLDLPEGEGLAAIRVVKDDPDHRRLPVVALTRRADTAAVEQAYDAGVNTVLERPLTFLALVRLMKVFTAYWLDAATLPRRAA